MQLLQIWVGEDVGNGLQQAGKKDTFVASPLWSHVLAIIRASVKGSLTCHYSNYAVTSDTLGLGLGTVSVTETWEVRYRALSIRTHVRRCAIFFWFRGFNILVFI